MYRTELEVELSHMHGRFTRFASTLSGFEMWSSTASDLFPSVLEVTTPALSTVLHIDGLKLIAKQKNRTQWISVHDFGYIPLALTASCNS